MSEQWVPLHEVFGRGPVPVDAAAVIRAAIDQGVRSGLCSHKHPWQLFELLAADFLAGARES